MKKPFQSQVLVIHLRLERCNMLTRIGTENYIIEWNKKFYKCFSFKKNNPNVQKSSEYRPNSISINKPYINYN